MPPLSETTSYAPDDLVISDYPVITEPETVLSGENLARGAVVGRVTASGKLKLSLSAAEDGSEVPIGIAAVAIDASSADAVGPIYKSGQFDQTKLVLGAGHTLATVKAAFAGTPLFIRAPLGI